MSELYLPYKIGGIDISSGYAVDLPSFGKAGIAHGGWENNSFEVNYGPLIPSSFADVPTQKPRYGASITFDPILGDWAVKYVFDYGSGLTYNPEVEAPYNLLKEAGNAILTIPEIVELLKKWRDAALKRLDKSVPRLKAEYEEASKKQVNLQKLKL